MEKYNWTNKIVICNRIAYPTDEFIELCIKHWTISNLSKELRCGVQSMGSAIKKYLPEVETSKSPIGARIYSVMGLRRCYKCKEISPFSNFGKDSSRVNGLDNKCKDCLSGYYNSNKEVIKGKARAYYQNNKEVFSKEAGVYYQNNKEQCADRQRKYRQTDKGRANTNASSAKRRAAKINRTPPWANLEDIKDVYNNCPEDYHVDHIIPLQGEKVSGLHIAENLQYLTAEENLKKSNKFSDT